MAIGPVQLIVLGFEHPNFRGEVIAELERLRQSDTVRVIDSLAVYKDAAGHEFIYTDDFFGAEQFMPGEPKRFYLSRNIFPVREPKDL